MTCKDCIHYDVCQFHIDEETEMTVNECSHRFVDKSKIIELPCKVGDTVYIIRHFHSKKIIKSGKIAEMTIWKDGSIYIHVYNVGRGTLNEKVFLTREEAEKALKEENES